MKVGILRCQQTEDLCPSATDFHIAKKGALAFQDFGPVEIIGFLSCGGCSGKKAVARAQLLVDKGAEAVVFASCISKGNPIGFPCPNFAKMKETVARKVGQQVKIIDWTH